MTLPGTRAAAARRRLAALVSVCVLGASLALVGPAAISAEEPAEPGSVVVTTDVLGSIVAQLVGDAADVTVLMDGGANPHTFEASARDAERVLNADVVVSNGLDLEEGLLSLLESARSEGANWFQAADHLAVRDLSAVEHEAAEDAGGEDHAEGPSDPHIWTDPTTMVAVVQALESELAGVGIEVEDRGDDLVAELEALDAEVVQILAGIAPEDRQLVTGHRSLGYFADRYDLELIGTVIPGLSTSGEPSARELAQLIGDIRDNEVSTVFTEVGTPQSVAQAVAGDSGARLVALETSRLADDGSYASFIRELATTIANELGSQDATG